MPEINYIFIGDSLDDLFQKELDLQIRLYYFCRKFDSKLTVQYNLLVDSPLFEMHLKVSSN